MRAIGILISAISMVVFAMGARSEEAILMSRNAELDEAVRAGKSIDVLTGFYKSSVLSPDETDWLFRRARQGVPPFQYEMARRIQQGVLPGSVIEWFAKGYVLRSLDAAECVDRARNMVDMSVRTLYAPLFDIAIKQRAIYADALEKAIAWEEARVSKPPSNWICPAGVLPEGERQEARAKQLEEIRAGIVRLKAVPCRDGAAAQSLSRS